MKKLILLMALLAAVATVNAGIVLTGAAWTYVSVGSSYPQLKALEVWVGAGEADTPVRLYYAKSDGGWQSSTYWDSGFGVDNTFVYLFGFDGDAETAFDACFGTTGIYANRFDASVNTAGGNDGFQLREYGTNNVIDQLYNDSQAAAYDKGYMYRNDGTGPEGDTYTPANWDIQRNIFGQPYDPATIGATIPFGTYVPEPATLVLLGLGSIAMTRRKK